MTITIFEALQEAYNKLKPLNKYLEAKQNPKLDAQILLSYCLKKSSSYLIAHGEEKLTDSDYTKFTDYINRRCKHEPVAYITGEKDFYRRTFKVTKDTLIPRPETEIIVDLAIEKNNPETMIVDVGTGSGAIAVTLAKELNKALYASDISPLAIEVAKENAIKQNVFDKIIFLTGDLLEPFFNEIKNNTANQTLDKIMILANLPYIPLIQYENLDPDVKNFEPKQALYGGLDGLDLYNRLLEQIAANKKWVKLPIELIIEIDPSEERSIRRLILNKFPNHNPITHHDLATRARFMEVTV